MKIVQNYDDNFRIVNISVESIRHLSIKNRNTLIVNYSKTIMTNDINNMTY